MSPNFVPLVFKRFVGWGNAAYDYLNSLAKRSRNVLGQRKEAEFRGYRRRVSVLLQGSNARVIFHKLSHLLNEEVGANFIDRVIQTSIHY